MYIASVIKETYPFLPKELGNKLSRTMFPLSSLRYFRLRLLASPPTVPSIPPTHFFHPATKLTRETDRKRSRMREKEIFMKEEEEEEEEERRRRGVYEKVNGLREMNVARDGRNVASL